MKFTFHQGTRLFAGSLPVALPSDTVLDVPGVAEGDYDSLAQKLASSQRIYADHLDELTHDETLKDGKKVRVTYGTNGARQEAPIE